MTYVLWTIQVLLALLFVWAGGYKLVVPVDQMPPGPITMPGPFLKFIGLCELLGGLGLVLPGLFRVRTGLTPLAAAGLVIIMIGAVAITAMSGDVKGALFPGIVGLLAAFVAYGRSKLAPLGGPPARRAAR